MPVPRDAAIRMAVALAVLTAVSTVVGLLLVHGLDGSVGELDRDVARALARRRTSSLDAATQAVTLVAETYTVAALWAAAMAVARWRTGRWGASLLLFVAVGGETLTFLVTSLAVDRPRPPVDPLGRVYGTGSFPSGHVGAAIALYGAMALVWGRRQVALGCGVAVVAVLVGWSRVYRGQHHPSDVLWGAVLGVSWLVLARRIAAHFRVPHSSCRLPGTRERANEAGAMPRAR